MVLGRNKGSKLKRGISSQTFIFFHPYNFMMIVTIPRAENIWLAHY